MTRRQGWNADNDPGVGIVLKIRSQPYLLDEVKVQWGNGRRATWLSGQ
jgi:hypothetical protein